MLSGLAARKRKFLPISGPLPPCTLPARPLSSLSSIASREGGCPSLSLTHDLRRNPPVVPRFLCLEAARHRAVVVAHADCAQPAVHERRHEPVRALFPRRPGRPVETRGRHPEVHP